MAISPVKTVVTKITEIPTKARIGSAVSSFYTVRKTGGKQDATCI